MHVGQGVHHQAKIMSFTVVLMMPARGRWVQAEREAGSRLNFDYAPSPCQEVACTVKWRRGSCLVRKLASDSALPFQLSAGS